MNTIAKINQKQFKAIRLVTGGAGFIGSAYLRYQVPKQPDILFICLDLLTYAGNLANLKEIEHAANFAFVKGSTVNRETLNSLFQQLNFTQVLNFAAESHVDNSIT